MFGVFVVLIVLMQLIFQTLPSFVTQRTLFEARERQSKTYAWQAFLLSNICVELAWHMVSVVEFPPLFFRSLLFLPLCHSVLDIKTNAKTPILIPFDLHLPLLVLSSRLLSKCRGDQHGARAQHSHLPSHLGHFRLGQHIRPYADRGS